MGISLKLKKGLDQSQLKLVTGFISNASKKVYGVGVNVCRYLESEVKFGNVYVNCIGGDEHHDSWAFFIAGRVLDWDGLLMGPKCSILY